MAVHGESIYIYSNDGKSLLEEWTPVQADSNTITITDNGANIKGDTSGANPGTYSYSGDKKFLGFATQINATEPTYKVGDTIAFPAYGSSITFYIVEGVVSNDKVVVIYNGSTIAELEPGQIAKLSCKNTQMESDLIVTVPQDEEDSPLPIEVLTETQMDELLVTSDIGSIFKYIGVGSVYENGVLYVVEENLISFTIDGTIYQAKEGMTWGEWIDSSYNTYGFVPIGNFVSYGSNSYSWVSTESTGQSIVELTQTITGGFAYVKYYNYTGSGN